MHEKKNKHSSLIQELCKMTNWQMDYMIRRLLGERLGDYEVTERLIHDWP